MPSLLNAALWTQSVYYVLTGGLPLIAMPLFLEITGPKTDLWLVRMVGLLAVVIGVALGIAAKRKRTNLETLVLSIGAALSFTAIDITYVLQHRISPIYLADAAFEVVLIAAVGLPLIRGSLGARVR